jgi:hypothetical protein
VTLAVQPVAPNAIQKDMGMHVQIALNNRLLRIFSSKAIARTDEGR